MSPIAARFGRRVDGGQRRPLRYWIIIAPSYGLTLADVLVLAAVRVGNVDLGDITILVFLLCDVAVVDGRRKLDMLVRVRLVDDDELTYPMNWGWIDSDDVIATIRDRPDHVHMVVTGRDAPEALIDIADTVSEVRKVKHAFDAGILAQRGVDY